VGDPNDFATYQRTGRRGSLRQPGDARTGGSKEQIRRYTEETFGYFLDESLADLRPTYHFDVSCQGSVPQSILAFLESTGVEDAICNAISLGGDADTMACIAGAIAEAFYGGALLTAFYSVSSQ
jgi:ADP-ribosylglycohydrolase